MVLEYDKKTGTLSISKNLSDVNNLWSNQARWQTADMSAGLGPRDGTFAGGIRSVPQYLPTDESLQLGLQWARRGLVKGHRPSGMYGVVASWPLRQSSVPVNPHGTSRCYTENTAPPLCPASWYYLSVAMQRYASDSVLGCSACHEYVTRINDRSH